MGQTIPDRKHIFRLKDKEKSLPRAVRLEVRDITLEI